MKTDEIQIRFGENCNIQSVASEEVIGLAGPKDFPWGRVEVRAGDTFHGYFSCTDGEYLIFCTGGADYLRVPRNAVVVSLQGINTLLDKVTSGLTEGCVEDSEEIFRRAKSWPLYS